MGRGSRQPSDASAAVGMSLRLDALLDDKATGRPNWLVAAPLPYDYFSPSMAEEARLDLNAPRDEAAAFLQEAVRKWQKLSDDLSCYDEVLRRTKEFVHVLNEQLLLLHSRRLGVKPEVVSGMLSETRSSCGQVCSDVAHRFIEVQQRLLDFPEAGLAFSGLDLSDQLAERYNENLADALAAEGERWVRHIGQEHYSSDWLVGGAHTDPYFWQDVLRARPCDRTFEAAEELRQRLQLSAPSS